MRGVAHDLRGERELAATLSCPGESRDANASASVFLMWHAQILRVILYGIAGKQGLQVAIQTIQSLTQRKKVLQEKTRAGGVWKRGELCSICTRIYTMLLLPGRDFLHQHYGPYE